MAGDYGCTGEAALRHINEGWFALRSGGTVGELEEPEYGRLERTFAVITVPSNELVSKIHSRLPAIIEPRSYERWLSLEGDPHNLLITYPSEPMMMWPISTRVNKPENDDPTLLERTSDPFEVWAPLEHWSAERR